MSKKSVEHFEKILNGVVEDLEFDKQVEINPHILNVFPVDSDINFDREEKNKD